MGIIIKKQKFQMCLSQINIKRCSRALCGMGFLLSILVLVVVIFSSKFGGNETFKEFEIDKFMVVLAALVFIGVLSCLTAFTMSKILNCCTTMFLFIFMILLLIFGAIFMVPGQLGEKFVTDGC